MDLNMERNITGTWVLVQESEREKKERKKEKKKERKKERKK